MVVRCLHRVSGPPASRERAEGHQDRYREEAETWTIGQSFGKCTSLVKDPRRGRRGLRGGAHYLPRAHRPPPAPALGLLTLSPPPPLLPSPSRPNPSISLPNRLSSCAGAGAAVGPGEGEGDRRSADEDAAAGRPMARLSLAGGDGADVAEVEARLALGCKSGSTILLR